MTGRKHLTQEQMRGTPVLAFANRFSRYAPMEEKVVREIELSKDPMQEKLKRIYKTLKFEEMDEPPAVAGAPQGRFWNFISVMGKRLQCSAKDVELFSIAMIELQNENEFAFKAGLFLSALINGGTDKAYTIRTGYLEVPLHYLGYKNRKKITVDGDVGNYAGGLMKKRSMIVKGNAGFDVGSGMLSGKITIEGNVDDGLGSRMWGGVIVVKGNAGDDIGRHIRCGEIHVEGEFGSLSDYLDEDSVEVPTGIYHKGKRIWPSE